MTATLEEFLDRADIDGIETIPADEEQAERFKLTSTDAADWAFRKLAAVKAERDAHRETARIQRDRIDAWLDEVSTPLEGSIEFFEGLLREYAAGLVLSEFAEVQDWSKVRHKTISTPNGKIKARRSTDGQFTSSDEAREAAVAILRDAQRCDLIHVVERIGATLLDEAREVGTVQLDEHGTYQVVSAAGEWVTLPGITRQGRGQISFKVETS